MSSNHFNNPIRPQQPASLPSLAETVNTSEPSKISSPVAKRPSNSQSTLEAAETDWTVLLNAAKNLVPPIVQPTSQQNIGTVIENSLSALSAIGMDSTESSKSKEPNWLRQFELQQELSLAVETGQEVNAAPSQSNQDGIAAFYGIEGQINSTQLNLMRAEAGWVYQLNQLSINQLNHLTEESDTISSLQAQLAQDQVTMTQLELQAQQNAPPPGLSWGTSPAYLNIVNSMQTLQGQMDEASSALDQTTNSFNTALQQMGITNVDSDNIQQFVAILQTMDRLKNTIVHMGDFGGENGLAIFTAVKDAMTATNQKIITLSSEDVQQMDDYNIDAANNLQVLNKELNAVQASMDDTQENLASLQSAAEALQITVAAETVTAAATCWIPVVGEVAGATLAATLVSLAGVEAAIGADSMQIAQDQEEIAGINRKMTNTMANAQFTEQTASSQTASITQLSKNLQEWVKNSNQVYANISNAIGG